jgi:hypothetical protein
VSILKKYIMSSKTYCTLCDKQFYSSYSKKRHDLTIHEKHDKQLHQNKSKDSEVELFDDTMDRSEEDVSDESDTDDLDDDELSSSSSESDSEDEDQNDAWIKVFHEAKEDDDATAQINVEQILEDPALTYKYLTLAKERFMNVYIKTVFALKQVKSTRKWWKTQERCCWHKASTMMKLLRRLGKIANICLQLS